MLSHKDFEYQPTTISGEGCSEAFDEILVGCDCGSVCSAESGCSCLMDAEANYSSEKRGVLLHKPSSAPIVECHEDCSCSQDCTNKVVGRATTSKVKLVDRGEIGKGLVADEDISEGQFVCEYAGEIIGIDEVKRRCSVFREHNFIFTIKEICSGSEIVTYVDARYHGNVGRYVNHSCDPNLEPHAVRIGSPLPVPALFAKRFINKGEELTYDYGLPAEHDQMKHKKIPTKNRKKLKNAFIQSQNPTAKVVLKKKRNWVPKSSDLNDQPLPKSLVNLQESTTLIDKKQIKQRKTQRNRVLVEAGKIGMTKGRFEGMDQFIRRVERSARGCFEEHKISIAQGTAGRSQDDIDADYKALDEVEKRQKDQKKREVQNRIKQAKKERDDKAKRIQEKLEAKMKRRQDQRMEQDEEEDVEVEKEENEQEEDEQELETGPIVKTSQKNVKKAAKRKADKEIEAQHRKTDAVLNSREIIKFGDRNDEPPKFEGSFKRSLDYSMAKAGGKTLLLHSIMKKETGIKTTYLENETEKHDKEAERLRVIEAYRTMKRERRVVN